MKLLTIKFFKQLTLFTAVFFTASPIFSIDQAVQVIDFNKQYPRPWFTGPLLCPAGYVVPVGHVNVQPYYYLTYTSESYSNSWKSQSIQKLCTEVLQLPIKFGVIEKMDFGIVPQVIGQHRKGKSSWGIADGIISAGFQLINAKVSDRWPALKLAMRASIPVGKYKNLDPKKLRTDIHGTGNYYPSIGLVGTKLYHLKGIHYLEFRFASFYGFATNVNVKGYSLYNAYSVKKGSVKPGDLVTATGSIQYNFTKNWALACDVFYRHQYKAKYQGSFSSIDPIVKANHKSSDNISLAPAIEYNFSQTVGIIGGCWLSVAGRNSLNFTSGVLSLNAYF